MDDFTRDPEYLAICSLLAGSISVVLVLASSNWALPYFGVGLAVLAIVTGVRASRMGASNKNLAERGTVAGSVALAIWVARLTWGFALMLWRLL